eukprot:15244478-Alexandrium_andersonii.AAC.1
MPQMGLSGASRSLFAQGARKDKTTRRSSNAGSTQLGPVVLQFAPRAKTRKTTRPLSSAKRASQRLVRGGSSGEPRSGPSRSPDPTGSGRGPGGWRGS